jgi:hypothetical protein
MTVCLLELGGKLDAAVALCNAPNVRLRARGDTVLCQFRSDAGQRRLERALHGRASIIDGNERFAGTFLFPSGCDV